VPLLRALGLCLAFASALFVAAPASADVDVPKLSARVTDLTGTLDGDQSASLERKLAGFENAKGSQIAVLIVPTTQPEDIAQYGIRVAEAWKLGRKGVDDGAILIVAKDDHRMRIEVGYGLEGALNDATCKRIISEVIAPHFKRDEYYEGIDAGLDRMIGVVNGEPLPPPSRHSGSSATLTDDDGAFTTLMVCFIIFYIIGHIVRSFFGSFPASLGVGAAVGLVALVLTGILVMAGVVMLIGAIVAFFLYEAPASRWGGGWGSGGFGGGGFGGGSFGGGGGGFSGGGGSFGGGGSSGSW
jgi:uncharacterized protein